ncbi:MAG: deoxynucleoside kinase [Chloroflexi bacterium]|nr:deoxynucleoside kinase [Chloroflexota bacterium]
MRHFFLAIEGVIGVGKTTLARLLHSRFKAELLLEAFEENPFLSDFYGDRARYAFQTQMFFLLSRYRQQQVAPTLLTRTPLVGDYTFAKDSLFARMNLEGDELDVYKQLYTVLADRAPIPDLVVYLRASTDLLMMRIAMRDRAYEREMDRVYIESLRQAYERHFSDYTRTPLLVVDVADLDYVQDPSALAFIEGQIRTALGVGVYQRPLPQMESTSYLERIEGPATLINTNHLTTRWETVGEFLAANEALGRVGSALADDAAKSYGAELGAALQDTMDRLQRMAQTVGVDLQRGA